MLLAPWWACGEVPAGPGARTLAFPLDDRLAGTPSVAAVQNAAVLAAIPPDPCPADPP